MGSITEMSVSRRRYRQRLFIFLVAVLFGVIADDAGSQQATGVRGNTEQVRTWNQFANALYQVHNYRIKTRSIVTNAINGGYRGFPNFYREIEYRDAESGELLSRIRWESARPDTIHVIELFFYDGDGRVALDYAAAYLPQFRNAPVQTLINVHRHDDDLHAFRQFDASGTRIYEQCKGMFFDSVVDISLDEGHLPPSPEVVPEEVYTACFGYLPLTANRYLDPFNVVPDLAKQSFRGASGLPTFDDVEARIVELSRLIAEMPNRTDLYLQRGNALFLTRKFDEAVEDFTRAIELDDRVDEAYFGRGMASGRRGDLDRGIADLSVYIERHPESSLAYTKRGVRYIWKGDFESARRDLSRAVSLDDRNAEAHDDLGVVLAQQGHIDQAIHHFRKAVRFDPSYQKAYHNLSMAYYMTGDLDRALTAVDDALRLAQDSRGSLLLKATILEALGKFEAAAALKGRAEFLPEANWSERSALR